MSESRPAPAWLVKALEQGREDIAAGRVVDAETVLAELEAEEAEFTQNAAAQERHR